MMRPPRTSPLFPSAPLSRSGFCRPLLRPAPPPPLHFLRGPAMTQQNTLRAVFWAVLVLFLAWDHLHSPPVDLRFEAPLIAAGSGKATQGGHCSMPAGK